MDSPYLPGIVMCQSGVVTQTLNDRTPAGMQRSGVPVVEQRSGPAFRSSCREVRMNITTIGIDLAKTSFSLVGSGKHGKIVLRKTLSRKKLFPFIAQFPPCLIGLEACSSAHYWAREFEKLGHQVRVIAVKFVEPYRIGGKNDNNDAEAICEAVRRPNRVGESDAGPVIRVWYCHGEGSICSPVGDTGHPRG